MVPCPLVLVAVEGWPDSPSLVSRRASLPQMSLPPSAKLPRGGGTVVLQRIAWRKEETGCLGRSHEVTSWNKGVIDLDVEV